MDRSKKSRAKRFEGMQEEIWKDQDPEGNVEASDDESGSDVSKDENAGTEHYVSVGKSKLRGKDGVSLGANYRGSRVSRKALEQEGEDDDDEEESSGDEEDFADPETADLERDEAEASDSEISSDNALASSDDENLKEFVFRGSSRPKAKGKARAKAADFMSSSDEEEGQGGADVDEDEDESSGVDLDDSEEDDMDDGLDDLVNGGTDSEDDSDEDDDQGADFIDREAEEDDNEDDEDDDQDDEDEEDDSGSDDGASTKKGQAAKPMLAALSNRADVEKGLAIQKQRTVYDGLLNLRIRLQKAVIAANTFPTIDDQPEPESKPYAAAEEAAIKLLNTINGLKDNISSSSRAGDKRKRNIDATMSSAEIWETLQEDEQQATKFREDRLEKWSRKVQSVNVTAVNGLGSRNKTLVGALQEQLVNPDNRLAKRSRTPRSCAPAQQAKGITETSDIYDDADFYQLLLKELVDARTLESNNATSAVPSVVLTAAKETKLRKNVDRKASKGRKMRFTVHEKLQNFMAPEDRRAWEQGAIDRFFGTLFGRKMELDEESSGDEMDVDAEEAGLRLFRN